MFCLFLVLTRVVVMCNDVISLCGLNLLKYVSGKGKINGFISFLVPEDREFSFIWTRYWVALYMYPGVQNTKYLGKLRWAIISVPFVREAIESEDKETKWWELWKEYCRMLKADDNLNVSDTPFSMDCKIWLRQVYSHLWSIFVLNTTLPLRWLCISTYLSVRQNRLQ